MSWPPNEAHRRRSLFSLFTAFAIALVVSWAASTYGAPGLTVEQRITPNDSCSYYVGTPTADWLLLHSEDTLSQGTDFTLEGGFVRLTDSQLCGDTLRLIRTELVSILQRRYYLHEFVSERSSVSTSLPAPAAVAPSATPSGFKVSGTKTFTADLSDRRQADISQGLALTLSGDIGHGVIVRGSFSDRGLRNDRLVTRRFSELENVYLEVESQNLAGRFGSFTLNQDRFHFLRLSRKVQGLSVQYHESGYTVETSLSLPPGNFVSNSFEASEGNYGPYLLKGQANELGVAVVEQSETVWLNGRKLERGRDEDYYIDYLQGELYFTGRRNLDTGDRVRVDFEYQKRDYRKTLLTGGLERDFESRNGSMGLDVVSFTASPDEPQDFTLSAEERSILAAAGDNPALAQESGARFVGSGAGDYVVDIDSVYGEVYRFVGDSLGDYQVSFTEVQSGDYAYLGGGQYQFVGPGRGRYLPIKTLPLPEAAHLIGVQGSMRLGDKFKLQQETALSVYDRNRLSALDDGDNNKVATQIKLDYSDTSADLSGSLYAELLPGGFFRTSRLDAVEEDYLWQRRTNSTNDRQRYLATLSSSITEYDRSQWEIGYTREVGGFTSLRGHNESRVALSGNELTWTFNLANAEDSLGRSALIEIKPELRSTMLPVVVGISGLYDQERQSPNSGIHTAASRRELGGSLSYSGVSASLRQREDWHLEDVWQMQARKRSLGMEVHRPLARRGRLDFVGHANWLAERRAASSDYQTGALDLDLPRFKGFVSINTRLRLNRRGRSETHETYLKVGEGEGDYILEDSTYVLDPRGDYILVNEQVGTVSQTVEAEKQVRLEFDLERLHLGVLGHGSGFRYETNSQEIGAENRKFDAAWLLPPQSYFDSPTFSRRRHTYRLRRHEMGLGLTTELEYRHSHNINKLDIARPTEDKTKAGSLLLSQRVRGTDIARLDLEASSMTQSISGVERLAITKHTGELSYRYFLPHWEYEAGIELGSEDEDSLGLNLTTYRLSQELAYKLEGIGRVDLSGFLYRVNGADGQTLPRELADGLPGGTNFSGRLLVDIKVANNFSLKVSATGELRDGEENRYYLRSELISRFE